MNKWSTEKGRMFLGNLDDSVSRYPWEGVCINLDPFNRTLIFHALVGPKLCVRSGNILYNDTFFKAVREPNSSPLLEFAKAGFIQLQTKKSGFNHSIEDRLEIGTNSTIEFCEKYGWIKSENNETYNLLNGLDTTLEEGKGRLNYNPDFIPIFKKICRKLVVPEGTAFHTVFTEWKDKFDEKERSRSNFEILTEKILAKSDYIERFKAMSTINSINHYAYGIALAELPGGAAIETKEIPNFQMLTRTLVGQEERTVPYDLLFEIRSNKVLETLQENLLVPVSLFAQQSRHWKKFASLLDEDGGQESKDFREKKKSVVSLIFKMLDETNTESHHKNLVFAARDYSGFLNSILRTKSFKKLGLRVDFVFRKSASIARGIFLGWLAEPFREELNQTGKVGVDILVSIGDQIASPAIIRGIDHILIRPEDALKIDENDIAKPFQGLVVRGIDTDGQEFLGPDKE